MQDKLLFSMHTTSSSTEPYTHLEYCVKVPGLLCNVHFKAEFSPMYHTESTTAVSATNITPWS